MIDKIRNISPVKHNGREITRVPTELDFSDRLGAIKVRLGIGRMGYKIEPGLYAVGSPDADSPVLVSANYKLSLDSLRSNLGGLDAWIIVLDTKGINVWCAAGKGTFGTDEIVRRIELVELESIVDHRKIIVPQLGATGVAAHEVERRCGFAVIYGPVRSCDIIAFMEAGNKATPQMRRVHFTLRDRLILTPMELVFSGRYLLFALALFLILSGLNERGYSTGLIAGEGTQSVLIILAAYLGGAFIAPVLLPWLPGRSFSFKGFFVGLIVASTVYLLDITGGTLEMFGWALIIATVSSYLTMLFTGASTYTSLSGVRKEMRIAVPLQSIGAVLGLGLWVAGRFI